MERIIHTCVVIDMLTLNVVHDNCYVYDGPVSLCGGGGKGGGSSTTTTVDYDYNARMANISEEQQRWARDYFEMWQQYYKPYEIAQAQENIKTLPYESNLYKTQLQTMQNALGEQGKTLTATMPQERALYSSQLSSAQSLLPAQVQAAKSFLNAPLVDVNERMALAQADVANSMAGTQAASNRAMARMGVNPNSGRFQGTQSADAIAKAAQMAGARTQARVGAEQENYDRLMKAASYNGVGTLLQSARNPVNTNDILQGISILRG